MEIEYKGNNYSEGSRNDWLQIIDVLEITSTINRSKLKVKCLRCNKIFNTTLKTFLIKRDCGCDKFYSKIGTTADFHIVLNFSHYGMNGDAMFRLKCLEFGEIKTRKFTDINKRRVTCSHGKRNYHGKSDTPTYRSWSMMRYRCNNMDHPKAKYYILKGITYPPEWEYFENFLKDMGERPDGTSLDRVDSNLSYSKENCRWADIETQTKNKKGHGGKFSKFKGAYYSSKDDRWFSSIQYQDYKGYLGTFPDELSAAKAWDKVAEKLGLYTNKDLGLYEDDL